jgi:hypothetical protein
MDKYIGKLQTDAFGVPADEVRGAHLFYSAAMAAPASADAVHAGIAGATSATAQEITEDITNPPCARNIVVTPADTTADVKAGDVIVFGTNIKDEPISETFAFLANASDAVTGSKAFKTVTKIVVPQQDGTGCTFKVGYGTKFGLPYLLDAVPAALCWFNKVFESTFPTFATDIDEIEKNTFTINGTLYADKMIDLYLIL